MEYALGDGYQIFQCRMDVESVLILVLMEYALGE